MEKLLKEALSTKDILEERVSLLKDEIVVTSAHHFGRARRHDSFFILNCTQAKWLHFRWYKMVSWLKMSSLSYFNPFSISYFCNIKWLSILCLLMLFYNPIFMLSLYSWLTLDRNGLSHGEPGYLSTNIFSRNSYHDYFLSIYISFVLAGVFHKDISLWCPQRDKGSFLGGPKHLNCLLGCQGFLLKIHHLDHL